MTKQAGTRAAVVLLLCLLLPLMRTARHATAATPARPAAAFLPVVVEWFGVSRPAVGQRETVHVRVLDNNKPVRGAHLTATVDLGARVLLRVRGGATARKGLAGATFTVPRAARGKTLRVMVRLTYKSAHLSGRNDLTVRS